MKTMNTIIENKEAKNEIFIDFCNSIKKLFKLPNELLVFPPFINNYIYDHILYYNYDEPNYFKFYDLLMAIKTVFNCNDIHHNNFSSNDIMSIIGNLIKINFTNDNVNNNKNNNDIQTTESYNNKNLNTFVELNIENSENYQLETDI